MFLILALTAGDDSDVISDSNFMVYFVAVLVLAALVVLIVSRSGRR